MVPAFIRYFACTDNSAIGALALALCTSMEKVAPVHVASMTGVFVDEWYAKIDLIRTPMIGSFANVIACDPARWTWVQNVPMPEHDTFNTTLAGVDSGKVEIATQQMSLYTAKVRNILFAIAPPRSEAQLEVARQCESVLVPNAEHQRWWTKYGKLETTILGHPMLDSLVRAHVVGPE